LLNPFAPTLFGAGNVPASTHRSNVSLDFPIRAHTSRVETKKPELSENGGIKTEKVLKDSDSDDVKTHININVLKEAASGDNPKNLIWEEALKFEGITRTFLGKLCKEYSEDNLVKAIIRTKEYCPADPKSFLIAVLKANSTDFEKGAI